MYAKISGMEAKCLRKKGKYGERMNEKVKFILWMNAFLEPKLLNPRKTMMCWKPNPITSLESPLDSILCVHCCMI